MIKEGEWGQVVAMEKLLDLIFLRDSTWEKKRSNKKIKCECGQWLAIEQAIDPIIFVFNILIYHILLSIYKYDMIGLL